MKLRITPYPFQKEAIDFHVANPYSINGYRMGLGKTLVAIGLAVEIQARNVLVVCPAFLVPNFKREIRKFCTTPERFEVISYNRLAETEERFGKYDCVIFDEAHYLKELTSKRTQLAHELISLHRPKYILPMSGTAIKNNVGEFYSLLRLCWYGGKFPAFDVYSGSFFAFQLKFMQKRILKYGSKRFTKFAGVRNVGELQALFKSAYIRKTAEEVLDLPERVHTNLLVNDQSTHDDKLQTAWDAYEGGGDKSSYSALKAVNALSKVEYTVEFVKNILPEAGAVVIYTDHVQTCGKIYDQFPPERARYITGNTSIAMRDKYVEELNQRKIDVLVSTIGALKEGVNITGINYMVFNDFPWVFADVEQVRKRIHRIGQTQTCFYYYVMSSKVDERIFETLKEKRKLIAEVGV